MAWSRDSTQLIFHTGKQYAWENVAVKVADGSTTILSLPRTDVATDWSPDGSKLCVMAGRPAKIFEQRPKEFYPRRQLYLYDLKTRTAETPFTGSHEDCISGVFSPDGSMLAYSRRTYNTGKPVELCEVTRLKSQTNSTLIDFTQLGVKPNGPPVWSPDGMRLAWCVTYYEGENPTQYQLWLLNRNNSQYRAVMQKDLKRDFFRVFDWR
jgi:Tol biopolymer transport system component